MRLNDKYKEKIIYPLLHRQILLFFIVSCICEICHSVYGKCEIFHFKFTENISIKLWIHISQKTAHTYQLSISQGEPMEAGAES